MLLFVVTNLLLINKRGKEINIIDIYVRRNKKIIIILLLINNYHYYNYVL